MENCPICNTKVKSGLFSSNSWTEQYKLDIINEYNDQKFEKICSDCANINISKYRDLFNAERLELKNKIDEIQNRVIISTYEPNINWDYDFIDFVSSSITMGTSISTEITSSIVDIVGNESNKYKTIIENAEKICLSRIKEIAFKKNGNAIVGFKMNISEVGGLKAMILVSMYGTLLNVKPNKFFNLSFDNLIEIKDRYEKLNILRENIPD